MAVPIEVIQDNIKQVPESSETRSEIRSAAVAVARLLDPGRSPDMNELRAAGESLLSEMGLPSVYLGYVMVNISNAFWRERFDSVSHDRRLLLLPQCLSDRNSCQGSLDSVGLHCAFCGACEIADLKREAESLGYQVITAEGTSSVLMRLLEGKADAVLGVACLDSLEKSHSRISQIGIPHIAVPLLTDGCENTTAEISEILTLLRSSGTAVPSVYRSYLPLLRQAYALFSSDSIDQLLTLTGNMRAGSPNDPVQATDAIALNWLMSGGKRLRPFVTLAAYAVGKYGEEIADPTVDPADLIPDHVKCLALAIEALHKASLVHDDIEDHEEFRYGHKTVQAEFGESPAVNVGDYLVGLGYNLISSQADKLGSDVACKILSSLSKAHLDLCRGQGAEIMWKSIRGESLKPVEALSVYALKTAPAFEASLTTGLAAAGISVDQDLLSRFCVYLGEAYQIENDLDDWTSDELNHIVAGGDMLAGRPTILWAFICEMGEAQNVKQALSDSTSESKLQTAILLLNSLGIFQKARTLRNKLRNKAIETAAQVNDPNISSLLAFLVKVILPSRIE